jgi:penicillin-binding protein 2
MSIGQGALTVTPLQMAVLVSAVANGGNVYRPRLIKSDHENGTLIRKMDWSREALKILRSGMHDVIQAETGTGKRAKLPDIEMAGKTGTAEYGGKASRKKYGWMIVFAPFDKPRYAIAMVVEEAISGGITIAPRIREVAKGIFSLEKNDKTATEPKSVSVEKEAQG